MGAVRHGAQAQGVAVRVAVVGQHRDACRRVLLHRGDVGHGRGRLVDVDIEGGGKGCRIAVRGLPRRRRDGEGEVGRWHRAEHDVALAGIQPPVRRRAHRANDHVVDAVPVHVPSGAHRPAARVPHIGAVDDKTTGTVETRELEAGTEARGPTKHQVAFARAALAPRISEPCADDHVVDAVAVHVPRGARGHSAIVTRINAVDDEAVGPVKARELETGAEARGLTEHHEVLARIGPAARITVICADDQVSDAVAVNVARVAHRPADGVVHINAVDDEAVGAIQARELEAGAEARGLAEHHVVFAGVFPAVRRSMPRADDHVVDTVAVHVPRGAHRPAAIVLRIDAIDGEAIIAVEGRDLETGAEARGLAEYHVALTRVALAGRIGAPGPDDHVVDTVAVHVPRGAHRPTAQAGPSEGAVDDEAVFAVQAREIEAGVEARRLAERHVTFASAAHRRTDDHVVDAVTVHVARGTHRPAAIAPKIHAIDGEAVIAVEGRELEAGAKARGLAEHHVTLACAVNAAGIGPACTNDHVVDAVAVHVPRIAHREAALVIRIDAVDGEAVGAIERCQRHVLEHRGGCDRRGLGARVERTRRDGEAGELGRGQRPAAVAVVRPGRQGGILRHACDGDREAFRAVEVGEPCRDGEGDRLARVAGGGLRRDERRIGDGVDRHRHGRRIGPAAAVRNRIGEAVGAVEIGVGGVSGR